MASTSTFLTITLSSSNLNSKNVNTKSFFSGRLQVKANAQEPHRIKPAAVDGVKAISLAAEKQWRSDMIIDPFGSGTIVQDGFVFRQYFSIRSYEIGADRTASMETLLNHLQETSLNHAKNLELMSDGFGSTLEMCKHNLIWVFTRMQVLVDRYPTWEDVVQVDTWVSKSGKNGMRRDWRVLDCKTGETLTRASCVSVMMNKHTRKLSKIPDEVRVEIEPCFMDNPPIIVDDDRRKLTKLDDNTADYIKTGLQSRWSDLDVNQHVNNVKYIHWVLESVPQRIVENNELSGLTMEYRRECGKDNSLQSLTAVSSDHVAECQHLLRLEDGAEILRARTEWRPKHAKDFGKPSQVSTKSD